MANKIMFHGKEFSGFGAGDPTDARHEEISYDDYMALASGAGIDEDTVYFISGAPDDSESGTGGGGGEVTPSVTGVTVYPDAVSVAVGTAQPFDAVAESVAGAAKAVTWSVAGNNSADTIITPAGILHVGNDETATSLTVTATSMFDSAKSGTATVTVSATALTPEILGIAVLPAVGEVERGHVAIFRVIVMSQGGADRGHEWELTGAVSTLTTLSATGLLKVGFDETAPELTLVARSIFDNTKTASATAAVVDSTTYALDQLLDLKEDRANKGVLGGYAPLGMDGKVPDSFLPDSSQAFLGIFPTLALLQNAYTAPEIGDYAFVIVSGVQTLYTWDGTQWVNSGGSIPSGTFVETVNGKPGPTVNLNYSNVGAAPASHVSDWSMHMTAAEKSKLAGLGDGGIEYWYPNNIATGVQWMPNWALGTKIGRIVVFNGMLVIHNTFSGDGLISDNIPYSFWPELGSLGIYSYRRSPNNLEARLGLSLSGFRLLLDGVVHAGGIMFDFGITWIARF